MIAVTNELIYTLMLEIQAEQKVVHAGMEAIRDQLATLNDTVRALAKTNVNIQREISDLKDRVTILTVAYGDNPPAHV